MLSSIRSFIQGLEPRPPQDHTDHSPSEMRLAAAALLVEQARMADDIGADERARIGDLVAWRFDLSAEEAASLVEAAEELTEGPAQWYGLTARIRAAFDEGERIQMIEMLWDVAYADGEAHALEANLVRRIAGLLYVPDRESGLARKRVLARYGLSEDPLDR